MTDLMNQARLRIRAECDACVVSHAVGTGKADLQYYTNATHHNDTENVL